MALLAHRSIHPKVAAGRQRSAIARPCVIVRSSGDAAAELERHAATVREALKQPVQLPKSVPVDVSVSSLSSMDSLGSKDGALLELDKDTFYPYLESQGDKLVVVDFFTDWCGPCKLMMPKLVALSLERTDVSFVKFNCNKNNKELGQKLGIKVAPTFHLYRNGEKVAQMTGADINKLTNLINEYVNVPA